MSIEPDILVVEDSHAYAEMILIAFEKRGWRDRVALAADGAEALDYLFCTGVHVGRGGRALTKIMLLDLHLPKLDGMEVLARLRQDPRTRTLPVFMMTGSDDDRDIAECHKLGIEGYIVKPARFSDLVKILTDIAPYLATV